MTTVVTGPWLGSTNSEAGHPSQEEIYRRWAEFFEKAERGEISWTVLRKEARRLVPYFRGLEEREQKGGRV